MSDRMEWSSDHVTEGSITFIKVPPCEVGDSGSGVSALQATLTYCGYTTTIDGEYGPATEASVKAFQKDAGMAQTGRADSETVTALEAAANAHDSMTQEATDTKETSGDSRQGLSSSAGNDSKFGLGIFTSLNADLPIGSLKIPVWVILLVAGGTGFYIYNKTKG